MSCAWSDFVPVTSRFEFTHKSSFVNRSVGNVQLNWPKLFQAFSVNFTLIFFHESGFLLRMALGLEGTMSFIAGTTHLHRITVRHRQLHFLMVFASLHNYTVLRLVYITIVLTVIILLTVTHNVNGL